MTVILFCLWYVFQYVLKGSFFFPSPLPLQKTTYPSNIVVRALFIKIVLTFTLHSFTYCFTLCNNSETIWNSFSYLQSTYFSPDFILIPFILPLYIVNYFNVLPNWEPVCEERSLLKKLNWKTIFYFGFIGDDKSHDHTLHIFVYFSFDAWIYLHREQLLL